MLRAKKSDINPALKLGKLLSLVHLKKWSLNFICIKNYRGLLLTDIVSILKMAIFLNSKSFMLLQRIKCVLEYGSGL